MRGSFNGRLIRVWGVIGTILSTIGCHSLSGSVMKPEEFFSQPEQVALAEAAGSGDLKAIAHLVEAGANVNAQGDKGMTSLAWAFYRQNHSGFEALLKYGADPNLHLVNGESLMSYAAGAPDVTFLKMALAHRGDPNLGNPKNRMKPTPLFTSAEEGNLAAAQLLTEAGTDIAVTNITGHDAASMAAGINQWHVTLYLLRAGAPLVDNASSILFSLRRHNIGYVPGNQIYEARLEVARFLRERGLSVEVKKPAGAPAKYGSN